MKKDHLAKLALASITGILFLMAVLVAATAQMHGKTPQTIALRIPNMIGLAMGNRGNMYTASRTTGDVFCIPPASNPVLLANIPGTPTSIAVDRQRNVFVGTEGGIIFLVSLDGTVSEAYRCDSCPTGLEIDRDGGLVIATEKGEFLKINRSSFRKTK